MLDIQSPDVDTTPQMDDVWLGLDVGRKYPAVDSDGRRYRWSTARERRQQRRNHTYAGPVTVTKPDGTTHTQAAQTPDQLADGAALDNDANQRIAAVARSVVAKAASTGRGIAVEQWSESLAHGPWVALQNRIITFARQAKVPVREVTRAYSSQTCPACDHRSADNRPTRDRFHCQACGRKGHADHVAAINLAAWADDEDRVLDEHTRQHVSGHQPVDSPFVRLKRREAHRLYGEGLTPLQIACTIEINQFRVERWLGEPAPR